MSTTRRGRPALIVLVGVSVVAFLGLAYWQFQRFESVTGNDQNLGYALQWPLFAAFAIWAYRRFVQYEDEGPPPPPTDRITEIPQGLLPERPAAATPDPEDRTLTEYNAYLAALAKEDRKPAP
ncbi:DNA-binding transcriptional regulator of glucitol operon [Mycobacteroides chelonae]|nr:DNA-binding transcriptional regulator of glucitol operon [Mycobacteroides chelonae]